LAPILAALPRQTSAWISVRMARLFFDRAGEAVALHRLDGAIERDQAITLEKVKGLGGPRVSQMP